MIVDESSTGVSPPHVGHSGTGVIEYPMIAAPLLAGDLHLMPIEPFAFSVATTSPGASGGDAGGGGTGMVTSLDAPEAVLAPTEFVAATVNVYEVPNERPVTVVDAAAGLPATLRPLQPPHAGLGVTVYEVIVAPLLDGAVHVSPTEPFAFAIAVTPEGAFGALAPLVTVIWIVAVFE